MRRVFGLDFLRALAIFLVLIIHGSSFMLFMFPSFKFLGIFGFLGVEFFFVLSGFLIGGIVLKTLDRDPSLNGIIMFWLRRWFRTLPNYFLFLGINAIFAYFVFKNNNFNWKYLIFSQNIVWEMPDFFPESWSLTVEEWFYLSLPVLSITLFSVVKKLRTSMIITLTTMLISITIIRLIYVLQYDPTWDGGVRKIMLFRLDSLMYGVFGAYYKFYFKHNWLKIAKSTAVVGSVTFLFAVISYYMDLPVFNRTFLFSVISFSVLCFLPFLDTWETDKTTIFTRSVVNLSLWSYSLYLSNYILYKILEYIVKGHIHNFAQGIGIVSVWFMLCVFISKTVYTYYEKPIMDLRDIPNLQDKLTRFFKKGVLFGSRWGASENLD